VTQVDAIGLGRPSSVEESSTSTVTDSEIERRWYAVYTAPQNEKAAARQLHLREIESFLPTFETVRVWKNRQRVNLVLPLFPSYLFVRIHHKERVRVLQAPGVVRIVGNSREILPLPNNTIEFLRSALQVRKVEPFCELAVGQKVRVKTGALQGVEGILVRKNNSLRFVIAIDLINQCASVEVAAEELEPIQD